MALLSMLPVAVLQATEVYKWLDDKGQVNYGPEPPPKGESERLELETGPSGVEVAPTEETLGSITAPDSVEVTDKPVEQGPVSAVIEQVPACHSDVSAALDPSTTDIAGSAPESRALNAEEQRLAIALLRSVLGRWDVEVTEVQCRDGESALDRTERRYQGRLEVTWHYRDPWQLDAQLETVDVHQVSDEVLWLNVEDGGLFSGTQTTTEFSRERSRVVPLTVGKDRLSWGRWFRQATGSRRSGARTELRTLALVGDTFTLVELLYVQDRLASFRHWIPRK
jgi:hypothetical protein